MGNAVAAGLKSNLKPTHSKGKLQANTSNLTSEGSDHGVHGVHSSHTKSVSLHSHSEHGDQESNDMPVNSHSHKPTVTFGEVEVSELTQMVVAPKAKKQKPAKPVKKVIAIDLPEDLSSIDTVTNALCHHGEILSVRVIKPGKIMPFDLKMYSGIIPDLGTTICAIVEFDSPEGASACVESETGNLRLALLKQGADATLYGSGKRINSDSTSEHTHGESGIGETSNRLVSNRDSLSNHSYDELEPGSEFRPSPPLPTESVQLPVFKQKALLPTPTDLEPLDLGESMTEVDFNNNEAQVVQPPVQNSQQSSKIISTNNGRITTALTITLASGQPKPIPRAATKLDLTTRRHPKINLCASQLLPDPVNVGRISPGLLSDPSDDLLVETRFAPEAAAPSDYHNKGHNQYKYNNSPHHNSHFSKSSYGKQ